MKTGIKKILLNIIFFCNIGSIFLLLLSNLAPQLNPSKCWPVAFTGILFPFLLITTFAFLFFWLFIQRKKALFSFAAILISIPNILASFAFNLPSEFLPKKKSGSIRIVTWNVGLMNYTESDSIAIINNAIIFKKLKESDADIICLQEFFSAVVPDNKYNLMDSIARTMNYPYTFFSRDIPKFDEKFYSGTILFSRYKITDSSKIIYPKPFDGSIIKTGILINNDTIDIFTTRLQSFRFQSNEYKALSNIKRGSDSGFTGSKNIISKLRLAYKQKIGQVAIAKKLIEESKRPVIFTGDLNDVPVSFAYSQLKNNMSDVWIKKGTGLGRTFQFISPTLRIDYIFFNKYFKALQVQKIITAGASDHYGLTADLSLIKKEQ